MPAKKAQNKNNAIQTVEAQVAKEVVKKNHRGFPNSKERYGNVAPDVLSGIIEEARQAVSMPKVRSDEELKQRIDEYFQLCAQGAKIPAIEEMEAYTGYSTATVRDWYYGRQRGFSPETKEIIKRAKDFFKIFDAKMVMTGNLNFLAYCFRAKNYYGMSDKQEVVITPNNPLGDAESAERLESKYAESVIETTGTEV